MNVTIVDLGYGNLGSIRIAFERLGAKSELTCEPDRIARGDRLVLPGVGSAGMAMRRIRDLRLASAIVGFPRPILGICLGMQLLFDRSEEDSTDCLGLIKGSVRRLEPTPGHPVPHMGWSRIITSGKQTTLRAHDYVWFAHGFACPTSPYATAHVDYGRPIPVVIERDNLFGCQFHPERSGEAGARFLQAFLQQ